MYGRTNAIHLFEQHLDNSPDLVRQVSSLSGKRLVCHCSKGSTVPRRYPHQEICGIVPKRVRQKRDRAETTDLQ